MSPKRLPEAARLKTSEVIRRAARELDAVDKVLAAELRVRALWIEMARVDAAQPDEWRRAIATIEDSGS